MTSATLRDLKLGLRRAFWPALLMFLLGYIHYHTFSGDRGLIVWYELSSQIDQLEAENGRLEAVIVEFEDDVRRLSAKRPDRDYLDELARRQLGVVKPNETVMYLPKPQVTN